MATCDSETNSCQFDINLLSSTTESLKISPEETDSDDDAGRDLTPEQQAKRNTWEMMQEIMKLKLLEEDSEEVQSWFTKGLAPLQYIAGVDISFVKDSPNHSACAMLTILTFPSLEVVHTSSAVVEMKEPYIPGFLAFREVGYLMERMDSVKQHHLHLMPQLIFVDGNGILHPRGFGLASHLGVLSGIPSIGIGKKLFHVDGLEKGPRHKEKIAQELKKKGDFFLLRGESGRVWGAALRTSDDASNPVYISVGHKISLTRAIELTMACSLKRVPEPIRQADIRSREHLRTHKSK